MNTIARIAVLAGVAGGVVAALTAGPQLVRAESPIEFFMNQRAVRSYPREPVYIPPPQRIRVPRIIRKFLQPEREEKPMHNPAPRSEEMQRVICRRACDGAQLVLGILPSRETRPDAAAMCTAAGDGAETELVLEKFVPGAGFAPVVEVASAAPLMEGRAALDTNAVATDAGSSAGESCPPGTATKSFMMVPILYDATLERGDVVATRDGFKIFRGRGEPPFEESDFEDVDMNKKSAKDLRKLQIADR